VHATAPSARSYRGSLFLLRLEPLHRAFRMFGFGGSRFAVLLGFPLLVLAAVELENASVAHLPIEHFQGSAAGVDLVVMR
jgi:hypothetical protein